MFQLVTVYEVAFAFSTFSSGIFYDIGEIRWKAV